MLEDLIGTNEGAEFGSKLEIVENISNKGNYVQAITVRKLLA